MTNNRMLDLISSPAELKGMTTKQLEALAVEIRESIVETVAKNGGHLASNLGVVELTLAIHSVFDAPKDKIIWDVGHQCYAHKMITGRFDRIDTIRTENGLSGFPKRSESEYDCFDTGHSSTSISSALGIACAEEMNKSDAYTVAVIGDGALSGGLAYEGLNNAGRSGRNLIVILNDNKMSISNNVGSMARSLSRMRIRPGYLRAKTNMHRFEKVPVVGKPVTNGMKHVRDWMRDELFGQKNNLFEQFGFTYYGPYDGHDLSQLRAAMRAAKRKHGPVLIHVRTKKGKGYGYAENDPKSFHGVAAFDVETGEAKSGGKGYSEAFGEKLCEFAAADKRICAITAAMSIGTGLSEFSKKYKDRFFDVGIAEEHAVTFASGLAADGMLPVFAVYSTFLQRSYDQILHDAAMQELHIVLCVDRAGIVGEDGETHQGIYDVAFLRTIPHVTIYSPSSFIELESAMQKALFSTDGVAVVRYPKGGELYLPEDYEFSGKPFSFYGNENAEILIVTYGREFSQACFAREELAKYGIDVCILKLNTVWPVPFGALVKAKRFDKIYFFEEGIRSGGLGEFFGYSLYQSEFRGSYVLTALNGTVPQAKTESALHRAGLDAKMIEIRIRNDVSRGGKVNAFREKNRNGSL